MKQKECVAMLLAGGEGRRLGALTTNLAKPAVHFGGKYRLIDFTLSNCANSGIDTVGVLTQYQPLVLNAHIGVGRPWDLNNVHGGVTLLPPYTEQNDNNWYTGTANAVYQNIKYIDQYDPTYVLVISGDHIYNMDYQHMLDFHKQKDADATISMIRVKKEEASRFGIMSTNHKDQVTRFAEKPTQPESDLASMGIYIFKWDALKTYLLKDEHSPTSDHDFGKNIIPAMINQNAKLYAYPFQGYWKDVGTIDSLWSAHMDLLDEQSKLQLNDPKWPVMTVDINQPPQYITPTGKVECSMLNEGCVIAGKVDHSVLFYGVEVGAGSIIEDCVIMPNVKIGEHVFIRKAIIGEGTIIRDGAWIGSPIGEITVVGDKEIIYSNNDKLPKIFIPSNKLKLERIG